MKLFNPFRKRQETQLSPALQAEIETKRAEAQAHMESLKPRGLPKTTLPTGLGTEQITDAELGIQITSNSPELTNIIYDIYLKLYQTSQTQEEYQQRTKKMDAEIKGAIAYIPSFLLRDKTYTITPYTA